MFSLKYFLSYYITFCFYHLSDQFIIPVYQISLLEQFIIPVYQTSLSDQFIRPVYQSSLSVQFISPVYQSSLSGQFIRTSICVFIIFILHPDFMKTKRLYQLNDISLQLCLRVSFKKEYISNHLWVHLVIKN